MKTRTIYSPEVQERAVRLYFESLPDQPSDWATILSVSCKIGCTGETLRRWIKRTNEILRKAAAFFALAEIVHLLNMNS